MPKGIKGRPQAQCHPERQNEAHGLCLQCYNKKYKESHPRKIQTRSSLNVDFPKGFYTYLWLREDGTPYYVGKGIRNRGFIKNGHIVYPPQEAERIITQEFESEADAFEAETFLIEFYGREDLGTGCLLNLTFGGEGASGYKQSEETKIKRSISLKGKTTGRKHSEEARRKMSAAHKGVPLTEEHRKNALLGKVGYRHSEETKEKMRKAAIGRKMSEEARRKMSAAKLGKRKLTQGR